MINTGNKDNNHTEDKLLVRYLHFVVDNLFLLNYIF